MSAQEGVDGRQMNQYRIVSSSGLVFLAQRTSNQTKLCGGYDLRFNVAKDNLLTPDEKLDRLRAELDRLKAEYPNRHGILRVANNCLRSCSKWKWEQHGWSLSDGESCGIMNGDDAEQRTALLSILKASMIQKIEFVPGAATLEVVLDD
jgi:hypothetical protein